MSTPPEYAQQPPAQTATAYAYHSPNWVGGKDVQFLLGMEDIPQEIRDRFWIWGSRILSLSNLNRDDINRFLAGLDFDILVVLSDPTVELSHKSIQWLNDLKQAVTMNLLRSVGGEERERKLLATQYTKAESEYREQLGKKAKGK